MSYRSIILFLCFVSFVFAAREESQCKEPSIYQLRRQLLNSRMINKLAYISMELDLTSEAEFMEFQRAKNETLLESFRCTPKDANALAHSDQINRRGICPWYYTIDENNGRFPRYLLNATTPCISCMGCKTYAAKCQPVTRDIQVLIKTGRCIPSHDGLTSFYEYAPKLVTVAYSFTCAILSSVFSP